MPSKIGLYAIIGILLSLYSAALITYGYGKAEKECVEQKQEDLEAALAHRGQLQNTIDQMADENAKLIERLKYQLPETPRHATVAQKSDTCNPTLGAVRVLNVRRGYPLGSAENPILAATEDGKASSLTGERIQTELEQCEADYLYAITRLNGLIDSCRVLQ